jgi:UDP-glucose 6-dehydrogenase
MVKIGICGLGFVGNAVHNFFKNEKSYENFKQEIHKHELFIYDKYKNINSLNHVIDTNILYVCLPTQYKAELQTYEMNEINQLIKLLDEKKYKGTILLKSTVIPTYCTTLNAKYPELKIIHNPEFLSAKTANYDFENQEHIIIGYTNQSQCMVQFIHFFYECLFPKAVISICTAEIAGTTKLACNSFYATKIQYFTELYLLCEKMQIPYDTVKTLMLKNNWINPQHTQVPGTDNNISFGGACFPKDLNALNEFMKSNNVPNQVVNAAIKERNLMRKD